MAWQCPNCGLELKHSQGLSCANGHSFDFAKQGYVNLLLDKYKKTKEPGDSGEMLSARRRFLDAGHYDFLVECLAALLPKQGALVDLGCGEGFYLRKLLSLLPQALECHAIDIAKKGIQLGAKASKALQQNVRFAVASTYRVPLMDQCQEVALSVFSPFCPQEAARILKPNGRLIRVGPGPMHLHQVKSRLYQQAKEHQPAPLLDGFTLTTTQAISKTVTLCGADIIDNLIVMTPLHFQGSQEAKATIRALDSMEVTFDFIIEAFTPIQPESKASECDRS